MASKLASPNVTAISLDVTSPEALQTAIATHSVDLAVSLVPYLHHADVIKAAIAVSNKRGSPIHVVTTSYVSPAMRELEEEAKKAGVVVMNEIGLDPGIDHLYAVKTISEVHAKGGKVSRGSNLRLCIHVTFCSRSRSSTRSAVAFPHPNAPTIRSATSSPGLAAECCLLPSTTLSSLRTPKRNPFLAQNS